MKTAILFLTFRVLCCANDVPRSPKKGFVPNATTAIRIGEAVLTPIYGEKDMREHRPFTATLTNDVWTVRGTVPEMLDRSKVVVGGAPVAEISRLDARILRVIHEK